MQGGALFRHGATHAAWIWQWPCVARRLLNLGIVLVRIHLNLPVISEMHMNYLLLHLTARISQPTAWPTAHLSFRRLCRVLGNLRRFLWPLNWDRSMREDWPRPDIANMATHDLLR